MLNETHLNDVPPKALAVMYAVNPQKTVELVLDMARHPVMWEASLRGHEAGSFKLTPTQADLFKQILTHWAPHALSRFHETEKRLLDDLGASPMERALKAIKQHNKPFLEMAVAELGDLNEMVDRQDLPPGTRLLNAFDGMKSAKSMRMSKAGALILASLLNNIESHEEIPIILGGKSFVRPQGVCMEIIGSKGLVTDFSNVDLALKTSCPHFFVEHARSKGMHELAVHRSFSSGLDRMLDEFVCITNASNQCFVDDMHGVMDTALRLAKVGILPGRDSFNQETQIRWQDTYRASQINTTKGPICDLLPGQIEGMTDTGPPHRPVGFWNVLAKEKRWATLRQASEAGFDIHVPSQARKYTPLHVAALSGDKEGIGTILALGADAQAEDYQKNKPRDWYTKYRDGVEQFDAMVQSANALHAVNQVMARSAQKPKGSP